MREKIKKIPVINCLVVNKSDNLPGEGIGWFIEKENFNKLTKNQRRALMNKLLTDIYAYPKWEWVLNELGLKAIKSNYKKFKPVISKSKTKRGKGESQQHIDFKNYLAKHPELFGLNPSLIGETEHEFPSMDSIDVIFKNKKEIIGVEAKSIISDQGDILRGLFQCVKYKALIEAEQKVNDSIPNCHVILALEGEFPKELITIRNILGIDVIDNI